MAVRVVGIQMEGLFVSLTSLVQLPLTFIEEPEAVPRLGRIVALLQKLMLVVIRRLVVESSPSECVRNQSVVSYEFHSEGLTGKRKGRPDQLFFRSRGILNVPNDLPSGNSAPVDLDDVPVPIQKHRSGYGQVAYLFKKEAVDQVIRSDDAVVGKQDRERKLFLPGILSYLRAV